MDPFGSLKVYMRLYGLYWDLVGPCVSLQALIHLYGL